MRTSEPLTPFEPDEPGPRDGASFDAAELAAALGLAVLVVSPNGHVTFASEAAARLLAPDARRLTGRPLGAALPGFCGEGEWATMRETLNDGRPRVVHVFGPLRGDSRRPLRAVARRMERGMLALELREVPSSSLVRATPAGGTPAVSARDATAEELRTMGHLARALVTVGDATALLELLLGSARALAAADGALLVQLQREDALVVSAAGVAAPVRGRRVFLPGTTLDRVIEHEETAALADAADLLGGTEAALEGPALATPLAAHGHVLGALVVTRQGGGFTPHEVVGLRLVADFVALALWKAHLVEEATSANQAKSNFLATISHELRTPLTTLIGYGELLSDGILGELLAAQQEVVERMSAVTHALTTTIDEILTYSSIEAGREVARLRETSGADLLRATHAVIEPVARQKGLAAGITLHEEPAPLCTDPDKVRQILLNLAGNGVKFTEQGGVHLSLARQNGALFFAVRDTGTGITEEDQARLFQPFTQLDGGLTRRHGGTGLGLYISHRLAALLGGRIDVESVPGNGSTFTLVLPTG